MILLSEILKVSLIRYLSYLFYLFITLLSYLMVIIRIRHKEFKAYLYM